MDEAQQVLGALGAEIADAQSKRDRFSALVFRSRVQYRAAVETATKSGKRIERVVRTSYIEAQEMGFRGDFRIWEHLLMLPA